jgi:peptidyl-prolyl cis-trans isomerase SurA
VSTRWMRPAIGFLAAAAVAFPVAARAQAAGEALPATALEIDRIVASVGSEAVTLSEVRERARSGRNPVAETMTGAPASGDDSLKAALDDLVAERLILAEARKLNLEVSEADVDRHVEGIRQANSWSPEDFAQAVKMLGFGDEKSYRDHARKELLKSQLLRVKVGSKVRVTDREVDEEFARRHPGNTDEEIHLWHIALLVSDTASVADIETMVEKVRRVREDVASGATTFEEAARAYGQDGSAARGGDVGWFTRGKLQAALENAAFALSDGGISPVVQSSVGFHVLRVTERRRVPLADAEEAKRRIRYELSESAFSRGYNEYVRDLKAGGRVVLRPLPAR